MEANNPMKVYRCSLCGLAWFGDQVKKKKRRAVLCPQDGTKLRDITKTKRAKRLLEFRERHP